MKNIVAISIIFMLPWMLISCKNDPGSNKTKVPRSPEIIDTTAECQQAKTRYQNEKDEELKVIDFFGVKMLGKYEDVVNNIYMLPMLSCVERRDTIKLQGNGDKWFSHTVEFCGVPCGMNADFTLYGDNIMSIHDLCFITSQTDDEIIHKFVSELKNITESLTFPMSKKIVFIGTYRMAWPFVPDIRMLRMEDGQCISI